MTRTELIEHMVLQQPHLSCYTVDSVVRHLLNTMTEALCSGARIEIRGFGSLERQLQASRVARNPKTGVTLMAAQKHIIRFKCGKELRGLVNSAKQQNVPIKSED